MNNLMPEFVGKDETIKSCINDPGFRDKYIDCNYCPLVNASWLV